MEKLGGVGWLGGGGLGLTSSMKKSEGLKVSIAPNICQVAPKIYETGYIVQTEDMKPTC